MDKPRFVIQASDVKSMAEISGLTVLELLPSLVKSAQSLARPPISKYHVGAVGVGSSGRVFIGVNLEFPGLPLHHSVHAEQFLLVNLSLNGETSLDYLAVSSAPCGHCRQFLQEIRCAPEIKILITSPENDGESKSAEFNSLSHLLPHRFGPDDLLDKKVPLFLEPHNNGLSFVTKSNSEIHCNGANNTQINAILLWDELKFAALEAANKSHAPYSGCPSGVAIMDSEGYIYKGSYMESAAYNPSLGPVQTAFVAYVAGGDGGGYDNIIAAVLVEKEEAPVKQELTARLLLQVVSPSFELSPMAFDCSSMLQMNTGFSCSS